MVSYNKISVYAEHIYICLAFYIFIYINKMHNMKHLNQYITEYIIKKKLDKPIDSEDHY